MQWTFILKIFEKFGFRHIWINWIKQCLSTTSFSILINGSPFLGVFSLLRVLDKVTLYLLTVLLFVLRFCLNYYFGKNKEATYMVLRWDGRHLVCPIYCLQMILFFLQWQHSMRQQSLMNVLKNIWHAPIKS